VSRDSRKVSAATHAAIWEDILNFIRLSCIAIALTWSTLAFAQTEAAVSGTVTDPSGGHVANAAVTAANIATGVNTNTHTNEAGIYVFPALPAGTYRISAVHPGFRRSVLPDVELSVGSRLTANIGLDIGQTTETVDVTAPVSEVNASSASIGEVVGERKILDLPLVGRSAYDLMGTQPGVIITGSESVNINGQQTGAINYTTDGINTQDNLLNGAAYAQTTNTVSIDRVEEFRIVTSPADAEYGRGGAQVQMITRGGTNQFHGSAWEELRNTDLNANDWFNNAAGHNAITGAMNAPRNVLVRNQFGTRFGGPVKKNKTFFHGIWEEDHQNQRNSTNPTVLTPSALAGNYRFFPGVQNGNAASLNPTVNTSGVPIQPASATGGLQTVSIFGRDPNRLAADPTGQIQRLLSLEPLPNNYLTGDGLNTAGYLWSRPVIDDFQLFEGRVDHIFNERHRITLTLNHQSYFSENVANGQPFPTSPVGLAPTETTQYSVAFTSTLKSNLVNEVRIGIFRPRTLIYNDYDPTVGPSGVAGQKLLPSANNTPYYLALAAGETNPVSPAPSSSNSTSNRITENFQYGDDLSWIKGKHSFKFGGIIRLIDASGFDTIGVIPTATIGAGSSAVAVQNINTIPGIGANAGGASNLLLDLSGSIASANANLNSPGGKSPVFIPGESRYALLKTREYSGYIKDDWKVTPSLTLNLGVRYEFYGVPYDPLGREQALVGGGAGIFGVSGTGLNSLFTPGAAGGSLTQVQLIGPGTNNPNTLLYPNDKNNFAPAVGLAWSLPEGRMHWLTGGKDKTVIRAGYGIYYVRTQLFLAHIFGSTEPNGLATLVTQQSAGLLNVGNLQLPLTTTQAPLFTEPINGSRQQDALAFANNLTTPYSQNFNFSIQREITPSTSLSVSWVGTAGVNLLRAYDVNEINITNNGFLQAYNTVLHGGDSPLMDSLLAITGLNSTSIRSNSSFQSYFANNNPAGLAGLLNSNLGGLLPNGGALLTAAKLPVNFFVVNPQFAPFPFGSSGANNGGAYFADNSGHSTYHSLQVVLNRQLKHGLTFQASYVFSKVIGDSSSGESSTYDADFRTLTNEHLDKQVLSFNHQSVFKVNGIYELPFGPGKAFASSTNGILSRIVGGWQIGSIFTYFTGAPLTITGANGLNTSFAQGTFLSTATQVGALPEGVTRIGSGIQYFPGITQVVDPQVANITTLGNLQGLSTLRAIAVNGSPVLINATPGNLGSLAPGSINGPGALRLDVNIIKRIRINERFTFQFGATAENLTNTEAFGGPNTNINSTSFGHITGTASGFTPRILVFQTRLNF
jgi:hypothetical protein